MSGRAAETSGRMQAGTEASQYSGESGRKATLSRRMMLGLSGRPDSIARRQDGWNSGQDGHPDRMARSSKRLTGNRLF
jgi:hypothetical protein